MTLHVDNGVITGSSACPAAGGISALFLPHRQPTSCLADSRQTRSCTLPCPSSQTWFEAYCLFPVCLCKSVLCSIFKITPAVYSQGGSSLAFLMHQLDTKCSFCFQTSIWPEYRGVGDNLSGVHEALGSILSDSERMNK